MSEILLSGKHLHKSYGSVDVLKNVSIEIKKQELLSIVGSSGAGKTTLLQILGTLDQADRGSILFNNKDITQLSGSALAKFRNEHIGFIFQFHHLLPEFSAIENVTMPALIKGTSKSTAEKRAKDLLASLGLSHRLQHKPNELSGGEQQRVATARAMMNQPSVIFADEPSGNLDSKNADELHQQFMRLRDDFGQTIVIVTHDNGLANLCDRKLTMHDGNFI